MKTFFRSTGITALLLMVSVSAMAQLKGLELYEAMGDRGFIQYEGEFGVNWLPGDMGYMETAKAADGSTIFYKVNPADEKKTPIFDEQTSTAITTQFNEVTNASATGLPFTSFEFVMDNEAIFYI